MVDSEYELGGRPRCLNVLSSVLIAINKRIATLNGVQLPQDRLGLRVEAVSNTPLDMSNPYGRTRKFRCKRIDFDAVQDFRAYQRCVGGNPSASLMVSGVVAAASNGYACRHQQRYCPAIARRARLLRKACASITARLARSTASGSNCAPASGDAREREAGEPRSQ
jgi:hypothetical protein